jgi:type IV fimbrial biogenesis protein FimT
MSTMRTHRRATAGFTLIEMMVVVIIMALLLAWALPAYKNMVTNYRMADELNQIQADVELARSSAIRTGVDVAMCPTASPSASVPTCTGSNEWNGGWVVYTESNETGFVTGVDTVLRAHAAFSGTDTLLSYNAAPNATTPSGSVNTIVFNRMGGTASFGANETATPNNGALVLNDANYDASTLRCLLMSEVGAMSVTSPQTEAQTPAPSPCP